MGVLITGGAGGLGRACAQNVAARGIAVGILDIEGGRQSEFAAELADQFGITAGAATGDIADPASVDACWTRLSTELGGVDTVINCAGTFRARPVLDITLEDWEFALRTNLTGPFLICQRAARAWTADGTRGSIVNVASTAAYASGFHEATDYGAAKAGLVGLTKHLAVKLGPYGIRTNAIAPSSFRSPMNSERLTDPREAQRTVETVPLGRVAEASEIAAAAVFLALDASYANGAVLRVDGGTLARM